MDFTNFVFARNCGGFDVRGTYENNDVDAPVDNETSRNKTQETEKCRKDDFDKFTRFHGEHGSAIISLEKDFIVKR